MGDFLPGPAWPPAEERLHWLKIVGGGGRIGGKENGGGEGHHRQMRASLRNDLLFSRDRIVAFTVSEARLAQSAERKALNLVLVGSSPTVCDFLPGRSVQHVSAETNRTG